MRIQDIYEEAAATTKEKGFDVSGHATQLLLIATEICEALEILDYSSLNTETKDWYNKLSDLTESIEDARASYDVLEDHSIIPLGFRPAPVPRIANFVLSEFMDEYLEELADIQIRLASYIGGNGWTDNFMLALKAKMEKNKNRPYKHGKMF